MKKVKLSIIIILILLLIPTIYITYITKTNKEQYNTIAISVKKNYPIEDNIIYSNQYGNYYIIKTNKKIIVLNQEYQEILKEDISILSDNKDNLPLIYKTNKLMYEEKTIKTNKVIYKYYDATTGEFIKKNVLKRQ